jgi:hypothetical protein
VDELAENLEMSNGESNIEIETKEETELKNQLIHHHPNQSHIHFL